MELVYLKAEKSQGWIPAHSIWHSGLKQIKFLIENQGENEAPFVAAKGIQVFYSWPEGQHNINSFT